MTENQKAWLKALYDDAIIEARTAVDNELTWADGAPNDDARRLHTANAEENEGYIRILAKLREQVDSPELQEEPGL